MVVVATRRKRLASGVTAEGYSADEAVGSRRFRFPPSVIDAWEEEENEAAPWLTGEALALTMELSMFVVVIVSNWDFIKCEKQKSVVVHAQVITTALSFLRPSYTMLMEREREREGERGDVGKSEDVLYRRSVSLVSILLIYAFTI